MRTNALRSAVVAIAALGAFTALRAEDKPKSAHVELTDGKGAKCGTAELTQEKDGVKIVVELHGLTPGEHGIHIHAGPKCEGPDFKSAGGHFNPFGKKHGLKSPDGPHAGDLENITADKDGNAKAELTAKLVTLAGGEKNSLLAGAGTSLVVHAGPDDGKTDPAGNSGARVACGVISEKK